MIKDYDNFINLFVTDWNHSHQWRLWLGWETKNIMSGIVVTKTRTGEDVFLPKSESAILEYKEMFYKAIWDAVKAESDKMVPPYV
jgi:hypothetical protein